MQYTQLVNALSPLKTFAIDSLTKTTELALTTTRHLQQSLEQVPRTQTLVYTIKCATYFALLNHLELCMVEARPSQPMAPESLRLVDARPVVCFGYYVISALRGLDFRNNLRRADH